MDPCLRHAGTGGDSGSGRRRKTECTGLHHHYNEITLRYLTGQADFTDFVFDGKCGCLARMLWLAALMGANSRHLRWFYRMPGARCCFGELPLMYYSGLKPMANANTVSLASTNSMCNLYLLVCQFTLNGYDFPIGDLGMVCVQSTILEFCGL